MNRLIGGQCPPYRLLAQLLQARGLSSLPLTIKQRKNQGFRDLMTAPQPLASMTIDGGVDA
ncbi:MAG: hypothetical protein EA001_07875 [Oscillatoriales cyanobacterium]|nr:MAG: hypothetical protein EA001_07875 [Oscillatoriales cyanobacterium]